jgi:ATP-dependent DNA helicase RecG
VIDLAGPVQFARGVGPERSASLATEGVTTVEDLLFYLPFRYEDRTAFAAIRDLRAGMKVSISGTIVAAGLRRARRISLYEALIEDGTGRLKALWFNQPFLRTTLERGKKVVLYGTVECDAYAPRRLMMSSPQYEVLDEEGDLVHTGRLVPVYEKLGTLTAKALRRVLTLLVRELPEKVPDPLPDAVRERLGVVARAAALREVHAPEAVALDLLNEARSPGHLRLILEELFLFQLGLARRRKAHREQRKGLAVDVTDRAREVVKKILPFHLTAAQKRVLREIADDMRSPFPMNRLVQGDVGCGKTMIALLSMVLAVESGAQAAFMAPTEILAEQHHLTFRRLLARAGYPTELLTASVKGKARTAAYGRVASGEAKIVVGTHALIQGDVAFHRLGLAVVDEQHRFGVLQRRELSAKGSSAVDVLVMTATPIPRTLALTAYGDLDTSIVDERPPGRKPVRTTQRPASARREVIELARRETAAGHQAYVVYPLVEESEKLEDVRAATEMTTEWAGALPGVRVGLLHGRMKSEEKEAVMADFSAGRIGVLVATTVIEVGVDVPNATLMVVEHAERFGLAQLHQLRGRVGRGPAASTCVLMTYGRLSEVARARMDVMVETEDGFVIAEKDLELRGPGDFFGTRQSGLPTFRVANLVRDRALLEKARAEAFRVAESWDEAAPPELRSFLENGGWEKRFRLARVG